MQRDLHQLLWTLSRSPQFSRNELLISCCGLIEGSFSSSATLSLSPAVDFSKSLLFNCNEPLLSCCGLFQGVFCCFATSLLSAAVEPFKASLFLLSHLQWPLASCSGFFQGLFISSCGLIQGIIFSFATSSLSAAVESFKASFFSFSNQLLWALHIRDLRVRMPRSLLQDLQRHQ